MSNNTRIFPCSCSNPWMNKEYGQNNRVHNLSTKNSKDSSKCYTCVVCRKQKVGSEPIVKKSKH